MSEIETRINPAVLPDSSEAALQPEKGSTERRKSFDVTNCQTSDSLNAACNPKLGERMVYAQVFPNLEAAETVPPLELTNYNDGADILQGSRLKYLQQSLYNLLPATVLSNLPDIDSHAQDTLERRRNVIKQEEEAGEFGVETRRGYADLIDWFEKKCIPALIERRQQLGISTDDANNVGLKPDGMVSLGINTNELPTDADLDRLDAVVEWIGKKAAENRKVENDLLDGYDNQLAEAIKKNGLPESWLVGKDDHTNTWRDSVTSMYELALRARTYVEVMDELNRTSGGKFPLDLPPGTEITRGMNGNIAKLNLYLPEGADMTNPIYKSKFDALQHWVNAEKPKMDPILQQLRTAISHPEQVIFWGDKELRKTLGKFDHNGNFKGYAPAGTEPVADDQLLDMNLLSSRIDFDDKDGRIAVTQHIQADYVPWWGYQNLVGVKDLGQAIEIKQDFAPDDYVLVRDGDGLQVMQAKDLKSYKNWAMTKYYGEKTGIIALDVGTTIAGGIGVVAAVRAARVGVAAAEIAGTIVARKGVEEAGKIVISETLEKAAESTGIQVSERVGQNVATKGTEQFGQAVANETAPAEEIANSLAPTTVQNARSVARLAVGASSIVNNAGARDSTIGEYVNEARAIYFVADIGGGLAYQGWSAVRNLTIGKVAAVVQPSVQFGRSVQALNTGSERLMQAAGYGLTPMIIGDFYKEEQRVSSPNAGSIARAAAIAEMDKGLAR